MARLKLHEDGRSFFDVKLAQRGDSIHAIASLRIPKSAHCSGFIVHDEFILGQADEAKRLLDRGSLELSRGTMRFRLSMTEQGSAHFELRCDSGAGFVAIEGELEAGLAKRFMARLAAIARSMAERA